MAALFGKASIHFHGSIFFSSFVLADISVGESLDLAARIQVVEVRKNGDGFILGGIVVFQKEIVGQSNLLGGVFLFEHRQQLHG